MERTDGEGEGLCELGVEWTKEEGKGWCEWDFGVEQSGGWEEFCNGGL